MPSSKLFQSWAFLAPNAPARVGEISPVGTQDDVGALAGVRLALFFEIAPFGWRRLREWACAAELDSSKARSMLVKFATFSRASDGSKAKFSSMLSPEKSTDTRYRCGQARTLNFTHAATESNIAQPPFGRQIRQLEEEVGCQAARKVQRRLTVDVARNSSINARAAIRSLVSKPSSNRW